LQEKFLPFWHSGSAGASGGRGACSLEQNLPPQPEGWPVIINVLQYKKLLKLLPPDIRF